MQNLWLLLVPLFAIAAIASTLNGRRRVLDALNTSFATLHFDTPQGVVTGASLRIVKVSRQSMPFAYDEVYALGRDPQRSDSFWYCVGPGPSYFLAIPMVAAGFGKVSVRWAIRPLTEDRMRAALFGDEEALRLAFEH